MIKRFYEQVEITPFYYQPLHSQSVKAFLEQQEGRIGLNLHVHQGNVVAYVGIQKPRRQQFFRNTSFPVVYPYMKDIPTSCFIAEARKAVCFPFQMDNNLNVIQLLSQRLQGYPCSLYLQLLLQKQDDQWKEKAHNLYEDYLNGIANPSSLTWVHQIQQKWNHWLQERFGEHANEPIPNYYQRVAETGFLFCLRMAIQTQQPSVIQKVLDHIRNVLVLLSAENGFYLKKANQSPTNFIRDMQLHRFPIWLNQYQILSVSELVPFFKEKDSPDKVQTSSLPRLLTCQEFKNQEDTFSSYVFPAAFDLLPSEPNWNDGTNYDLFERLVLALHKVGIRPHQPFELINMQSGPSLKKVTLKIPAGVKLNDLEREQKNLEAELGTSGMQIARGAIPGTVYFSVMKEERSIVWLKDILKHPQFAELAQETKLPLLIGKNEIGEPFMDCLDRLKHLLICGTTGSGKSFFLNGLIVLLMMLRSPEEIRFYLIDPKRVEFSLYQKSVHTETVETDPPKAIHLLQALVKEMERRYELFSEMGVRHIDSYNQKASSPLPRLIVVIDEFADLILLDSSVEEPVVRLGQLARASGIHVILATQRPSVNVVTGLIKANLPSRIVFACSSQHDYKTALDIKPPKLLGKGDGVAQLEGMQELIRFQGAVVTFQEEDLERILESLNDYWGQAKNGNFPIHMKKKRKTIYNE